MELVDEDEQFEMTDEDKKFIRDRAARAEQRARKLFAKVDRIALQNAASVAGLLLTTDCIITEAPSDESDDPHGAPGGGMPGMGGMGGGMPGMGGMGGMPGMGF